MKIKKGVRRELVFEMAIFLAGIMEIFVLYRNALLLTLLLMASWIIGIKFWHKKHDIYFFVIGAVVGSIAEIVCVHSGAWQYASPDFLGIPVWLPLAWGISVMMIKRISETFVKIEMK